MLRVMVMHQNLLRGNISQRMGLAHWRQAWRQVMATGVDLVLCGHDHEEGAGALPNGAVVATTADAHIADARAPAVSVQRDRDRRQHDHRDALHLGCGRPAVPPWPRGGFPAATRGGVAGYWRITCSWSLSSRAQRGKSTDTGRSLAALRRGQHAPPLADRLFRLGLPPGTPVTLTRNRTVMISWRARSGLRLHAGYAGAPDDVLRAIVRFIARGVPRAERAAARRRFMTFPIEQHAASRRPERPRALRPVTALRPGPDQ